MVKNPPVRQETQVRSLARRSPGEENGYPLQYSCLENPKDREAWWATAHGAANSQIQLTLSLVFTLKIPPKIKKWCWYNYIIMCKRIKPDPYLTLYTKFELTLNESKTKM